MSRPNVSWHDLARCSAAETLAELALPLPWLLLALWAGANGWYAVMVIAAVAVFMLGLRIGHNAFHGNLGLTAPANDAVLASLSVLMVGSLHAIHHTHSYHHRHCMAPDDIEGQVAAMPFWQALRASPAYPLYIHLAALKQGSRKTRRWVIAELVGVICWQLIVWRTPGLQVFAYFSVLMMVANTLAPMVGIWAVHRACENAAFTARTCRTPWLNWLTAGMFYHLEHHLFPGVPTRHLPVLARRLDEAGWSEYRLVDKH